MAQRAEAQYNSRLREVAKNVRSLIGGVLSKDLANINAVVNALRTYADVLDPWARSVASYMLADVSRRNYKMWKQNAVELGEALRHELETAPTGRVLAAMMRENVSLIKSLPLHAAERVHQMAMERLVSSERSLTMIDDILAQGSVTESRARMIARTEVSRANAMLLQARAEYTGSEGYIWRTVGDHDVRESHKRLDGKYIRWDSPPTTDKLVGHAGCLPNCRCTAEPVLPGETIEEVKGLGRQTKPHARGAVNAAKRRKFS